jgi:hypothetical protein
LAALLTLLFCFTKTAWINGGARMKRTDIRLRELRRFAITYKISVEQAGRLLKRYGLDSERLAAAAAVLALRRQRLSKPNRSGKQHSDLEQSSAVRHTGCHQYMDRPGLLKQVGDPDPMAIDHLPALPARKKQEQHNNQR